MRFVEIKGDDEFEFKTVVKSFGKSGECLFCNYVRVDDEMKITLEASTEKNSMKAYNTLTYRQFCRLYPKHRIYMQGYIERE